MQGVWAADSPRRKVLTPCPRCLPGRAAKWKFPCGPAHLCSHTSIPPSRRAQQHRAPGSAGLLRCLCSPVPCPGIAGRENCSQTPPEPRRGTGASTESSCPGQGLSLSLLAGSDLPLLAAVPWGGGRSGGSVPGPARKPPRGCPGPGNAALGARLVAAAAAAARDAVLGMKSAFISRIVYA